VRKWRKIEGRPYKNTEVCTFFMHASERKIFRIQEKEKMVEKFYHVPKAMHPYYQPAVDRQ
jgi:hypothetical protein